MAKDRTDKHNVATKEQTARSELEFAFTAKAIEYLEHFETMQLVDGAVTLFSLGITFKDIDGIRYPQITDEQLQELLIRAQSEADAFRGALYIARLWMARRTQLPDKLLSLVLSALRGNVVKSKGGRNRAPDTPLRAFMYAWALFIHQNSPDIPLVRSEHKTKGWTDWSACDLVARAFSDAGKYTTFQQVKSYCYDESYWHVRAAASMMWQKGRKYEDTGCNFDFDMDAFCFGKP
jgi:hypothetical protein